jgi:hypothetical protein
MIKKSNVPVKVTLTFAKTRNDDDEMIMIR